MKTFVGPSAFMQPACRDDGCDVVLRKMAARLPGPFHLTDAFADGASAQRFACSSPPSSLETWKAETRSGRQMSRTAHQVLELKCTEVFKLHGTYCSQTGCAVKLWLNHDPGLRCYCTTTAE